MSDVQSVLEYLGGNDAPLGILQVLLRLAAAAVLGLMIGLERGIADKPADGRTMALISAGACGFILLGIQVSATTDPDLGHRLDPTRVLSYLISGVGFLGAGAILHSKRSITGMTTAAAIWVAAALGAACGFGSYAIAGTLFLVLFTVLWIPTIRRIPAHNGAASGARPDLDEPTDM